MAPKKNSMNVAAQPNPNILPTHTGAPVQSDAIKSTQVNRRRLTLSKKLIYEDTRVNYFAALKQTMAYQLLPTDQKESQMKQGVVTVKEPEIKESAFKANMKPRRK